MPLPAAQKVSTDATDSEAYSTDSRLQLQQNGKFVQRVMGRLKNSTIFSLLRNSTVLSGAHNSKNDDQAEIKTEQAAEVVQPIYESTVSEEAAIRKAAEKFYTVDTSSYDLKSVIEHYRKEDRRIMPNATMKFMMGHKSRCFGGSSGGRGSHGTRDGAGCSVHPLLDKLAHEFCLRMGLLEVSRLPTSDERIFLWLSRNNAHRMLGVIERRHSGNQVYFVNRVHLDNLLTDLQCMCSRMSGCVARSGQVYPAHCCTDPEKIREHRLVNNGVGPMPRFVYVDRQVLCLHLHLKQNYRVACVEPSCPNYGKRLCTCFQTDMFIPDTTVLATKKRVEEVRANLENKTFGNQQRWLIRASNVKGGNGSQFIDTVSELETFLRYDIQKKLRGQFYVLQRHLQDPLLLEGKRVDLRMFLLVVVLTDRRVLAFLHPGYMRQAQMEYIATSNDLRCHLTWPFTWDPDYNRYKSKPAEGQASQPDYCRPYADGCSALGFPGIACEPALDAAIQLSGAGGTVDESGRRFLRRLNRIVHYLAGQIDSIVCDKPGSWQLFGIDLLPDADKTVWLHDVMSYPCHGEPDLRSATQNTVLPGMFTEALALVMELNQRDVATRARGNWLDLPDVAVNQPGLIAAQKNFVWLYSTDAQRLITFRRVRHRTKPPHWYHQWRVTEDFNDYILYLKNHRIATLPLAESTVIYGRKSFEHSPAEKFRRMFAAKFAAQGGANGESVGAEGENVMQVVSQ